MVTYAEDMYFCFDTGSSHLILLVCKKKKKKSYISVIFPIRTHAILEAVLST